MKPVLLTQTARTACFEIVDSDGPELAATAILRLNGEPAGRTENAVFSLFGLEPDTDYTLEIDGGPALAFRTNTETACLDIRDFGAQGKGRDVTHALQAAIAACPAGGTIMIPAGTWSSGPLFLKSAITLYLAKGAILRGLADRRRYPILPARIEMPGGETFFLGSWEGEPDDCYASLLTAIGLEDIAIVGEGTIDGNAANGDWWQWPKEKRGGRRPRTVFFNDCSNVLMQGVSVRNSPSWTIHPLFCRALKFLDLAIDNPADSPNTDGLDPESCEDVEIAGVRFSVGDDCIAIKSGKLFLGKLLKRPSRNIRIRRCLMARGHGAVVIGSEMAGGVHDVEIGQCRFEKTDRGLRIKTRRGRGRDGVVQNISLRDVIMKGVADPFVINCFYFCDADGQSDYVQNRKALPVDERTPEVRDIVFENVVAGGAEHAAAYLLGLPERPVTGVVMRNVHVTFSADPEPGEPAMACGVAPVARAGVTMLNVVDPVIENVTVDGGKGPSIMILGDCEE